MNKNYFLAALFCIGTGMYAQGWIPNAVQIVHNSASPTLTNVKVWVNDTVWMNSLSFQQASPRASFSDGTYTVGVSATTATAQSQSILQQTFAIGTINSTVIDAQFLTLNGLSGNASTPLSINTYSRGQEGQPSPFGGFLFFYNGCTPYNSLNVAFTPSVSFGTSQPLNSLNIGYAQLGRRDVDFSIQQNSTYTISVSAGTTAVGSFLLPSSAYAQKEVNVIMNSSFNIVQRSEGIGFGLMIVPASGGSITPVTRIQTPTGLEGVQAEESSFTVFPNPANDLLHITMNSETALTNLKIIDLSGRIMMARAVVSDKETLDLAGLEAGVYFLNVTEGNATRTVKLIRN